MSGKYFEQFTVGEQYTAAGRTVTETDVVIFSTLIGALSPLFLDEEYAKKTIYGTRIAPGELPLSMAMAMTEPLVHGTVIGLLGVNNVRFIAPVKPGDTITNYIEVVGKRESSKPGRGIIMLKDTVRNQRGEVVLEFEHQVMVARQPS